MRSLKVSIAAAGIFLFAGLPVGTVSAQGPEPGSSETIARPKKKDVPADAPAPPSTPDVPPPQPKIPSKFSTKGKDIPEGTPTFRSDVNTVELEVAVLDNKGRFIPNIPKGNFRVLEDNVPQQIATFNANGDAPMTIAMVVEFNAQFQQIYSQGWFETLNAAYGFAQQLKPEDFFAVVAYDLKTEILSDFTTDREKTAEAMQRLRIPGFSESCMYDALADMETRMSNIEGRKAILLIATGRDTLSKLTFDKARKAIQEGGVPIYAISLLQALRIMAEPYMGEGQRMDFIMADNVMNTFARETGGQAFFPRFYAEYPQIYKNITDALRNQYSITYAPTNQARDGKYRKLKVDLVDPASGQPLKVVENGKPIKYTVIAKQGYNAPREVE